MVMGYFLLPPGALERLAQSTIAQSLLYANIHFWQESGGYFAEAAEYQPLLHTWSLAVEEQFYLFFPFLAVLIFRWRRAWFIPLLVVAGVVSFAVGAWSTLRHPAAAFYLLPPRAWELTLGALAASLREHAPRKPALAQTASGLGLAMIVAAMFFISRQTLFPGYAALLPVAGSALFIFGNEHRQTLGGRLLSWKPVVFVGLISYSLYLWHWPLLVYGKWTNLNPSVTLNGALLIIAFGLSVLTWRFVEQPFRRKTVLPSWPTAYPFAVGVAAVMIAISGVLIHLHGLPERLPPDMRQAALDLEPRAQELHTNDPAGVPLGIDSSPDEPLDFVLWGDSHARTYATVIDQLAKERGLRGRGFLTNGCTNIPGLVKASATGLSASEVIQLNDQRTEIILRRKPKMVILVAAWAMTLPRPPADGSLVGDMNSPKWHQYAYLENGELRQGSAPAVIKNLLQRLIDRLAQHDIKVTILEQVPILDDPAPARAAYIARRFPWNPAPTTEPLSLAQHLARQAAAKMTLEALAGKNLTLIDPTPAFFPEGEALEIFEQGSLYRDDNHLTKRGVERKLKPIFVELLDGIGKSESRQGRPVEVESASVGPHIP